MPHNRKIVGRHKRPIIRFSSASVGCPHCKENVFRWDYVGGYTNQTGLPINLAPFKEAKGRLIVACPICGRNIWLYTSDVLVNPIRNTE